MVKLEKLIVGSLVKSTEMDGILNRGTYEMET